METGLITNFFSQCAPEFFLKELRLSLSRFSSDSAILSVFLSILDSLYTLLSKIQIPPTQIVEETLRGLYSTLPNLPNPLSQQVQFLINFELLRVNPTQSTVQTISKLGRTLSFQMAIAQDSSAFNKFFLSNILERYYKLVPRQCLLDLSLEFELYEETQEFLANKDGFNRKGNENEEKLNENTGKIDGKNKFAEKETGKIKEVLKFGASGKGEKGKVGVGVGRSFAGNGIKKQVSVKNMKKMLSMTPKRESEEISVEAKDLKVFNQKFFYGNKEGVRRKEEIVEYEGEVLVPCTPTREEEVEEDLWKFKSVFQA